MVRAECLLVVVFVVGGGSCWVFNNVDYRRLASVLEGVVEDAVVEVSGGADLDTDVEPMERFSLIFPGTKWCGAGNVAESYDDLGASRDTDICCREHDYCSDILEPGMTKYNLTNEAFYTRLNCSCDVEFRRCLHAVNSKTSTVIGKMYFNAIGTKCFRSDYPVTGCNTKGGWLNSKCLEYEYDTSGEQRYQWFDVPNY